MDELYLVAYSYEANSVTKKREIKSISFTGEQFKHLRTPADIRHKIEKQTPDNDVEILAVTALHKLIDYASENQANSPSSAERGH